MLHELYTPQGETLREIPWQVYPRPQLARESYVNLNGIWDFTVSESDALPEQYDARINVPFCPESQLSGLKMTIKPGSYLFYHRKLSLEKQNGRLLLHMGAADQVADIYVNQIHVCHHRGGYTAFTADITDAVSSKNELVIRVWDDLRDTTLPYGKQTLCRGGMWYTPVSGIWQTVWLEWVPENYIEHLDIRTDADSVSLTLTPPLDGAVNVAGKRYLMRDGKLTIRMENPHQWCPEDPYLYHFTVETEQDRVSSYFALRSIETQTRNGIPRLCLNGKPYFFHGLLDQGYWPDGLFTPAAPECYAQDIQQMKKLGFNTLRKHIKVEPEEFYYQCDRLGMVVFQDMVNNGDYNYLRDTVLPTLGIQRRDDRHLHPDEDTRQAFLEGMTGTVRQLGNHPCILYWTIFNEGWGQFDSEGVYEKLKALDGSRIIDATSGWFRRKKTDVDSRHIYFTPWSSLKPSDKPLVLSEFGGYACPVEGHLFNTGSAYGYKSCKRLADLQDALDKLYREKVLPAAQRGLCAAILTQISDVEDEINGLLTYDRKVSKADSQRMQSIAVALQAAVREIP